MQLNSLMASGLNNKVFKVPCINQLIQKSDGFKKKELATYKIDLQLLCGFGCRYCSSNAGLNIKFKKKTIEQFSLEQLGKSYTPKGNPELSIELDRYIVKLEIKLKNLAMNGDNQFAQDYIEKRKMETIPNFSNSLQFGMTPKEVEKIQGVPKFINETDEVHGHFEMWTYPTDSATSHLYFENNKLIRIEK